MIAVNAADVVMTTMTSCGMQSGSGRGCRNTWHERVHRRIQHGKCESLEEFQLSYCNVCNKRHRCCGPDDTGTEPVEFKCPGQPEVVIEHLMIIHTCKCYRQKECPFL